MTDPALAALFAEGLKPYEDRQSKGKYAEVLRPPKVLTMWQPWAWAVIHGSKRIENRGRQTAYRGRLLIHTGLGPQSKWANYVAEQMAGWPARHPRPTLDELRDERGLVIGEVTLAGTEPNGAEPANPWAIPGQVGWRLENPIAYARPFQLTGQQGMFTLPVGKLPELRRAGSRSYRLDDFDVVAGSAAQAVAACSTYGVSKYREIVRVNGHPTYFGELVAAAARACGDEDFAAQTEARTGPTAGAIGPRRNTASQRGGAR